MSGASGYPIEKEKIDDIGPLVSTYENGGGEISLAVLSLRSGVTENTRRLPVKSAFSFEQSTHTSATLI
jgi:hypothetical protein